MITCRDLLGFLHDYAAGALNEAQTRTFEEHLTMCPPCVAYLASYRAVSTLSLAARESDATSDELPEDLVRAILAARDTPSAP